MMGWYQDGVGWGGWIVMALVMVAFWALVVFAVVGDLPRHQQQHPTG